MPRSISVAILLAVLTGCAGEKGAETPSKASVDALVARKRWGEALEKQSAVAGPTDQDSSERQRYDAIKREAAAYWWARARDAVMAQQIAGVQQTGFFVPIVAQLELRISGPAVVTASGWMSPTTNGTYTRGFDLVVPAGRSDIGIRLSAEQQHLHTELPNPADSENSDSVGIRQNTTFTAGVVLGL